MFTILIQHTSFRLWHCVFPAAYLRKVRYLPLVGPDGTAMSDDGGGSGDGSPAVSADVVAPAASAGGVTLRCSGAYDFACVAERGAWLDVLVALVQYLQSGESRVGFLNKALERNKLHKRAEEADAQDEAEAVAVEALETVDADSEDEDEDEDEENENEKDAVDIVNVETAEETREVAPRNSSGKRRFDTGDVQDKQSTAQHKSQRRRRV